MSEDKVRVALTSPLARLRAARLCTEADQGTVVEFRRPTRSVEQNARMWSMLADLSRQVVWHGEKLTADEWKDVLTAGIKRQRAVKGIDGGFVVLGARTSQMSIKAMTELMDLIDAFGTQQGVTFKVFDYFEEMRA